MSSQNKVVTLSTQQPVLFKSATIFITFNKTNIWHDILGFQAFLVAMFVHSYSSWNAHMHTPEDCLRALFPL